MTNLSEKPVFKFFQSVVFALITTYFLLFFLDVPFQAVWTGVFVFFFYHLSGATDKITEEFVSDMKRSRHENIFIDYRYFFVVFYSFLLLFITTVTASSIYSTFIVDKVCDKESSLYSKEECVLEEVKQELYDDTESEIYP